MSAYLYVHQVDADAPSKSNDDVGFPRTGARRVCESLCSPEGAGELAKPLFSATATNCLNCWLRELLVNSQVPTIVFVVITVKDLWKVKTPSVFLQGK